MATTDSGDPFIPSKDPEGGYLGKLTQKQEQALAQLQASLLEETNRTTDVQTIEYIKKRYHDVRLCRFLRARQFDPEATKKMIMEDIKWRKEWKVDTYILGDFTNSEVFKRLREYWPGKLHGIDKLGAGVWWECIGMVDPKSIFAAVSLDDCLRFHIYSNEMAEQRLEQIAVTRSGTGFQEGQIIVQDFAGLGLKHMSGIGFLQKVAEMDEAHYPELLRRMYLINTPKIFFMFWKLIVPWLDKRTAEKIIVCGADQLETLSRDIPQDQIPPHAGGTCKEGTILGGGIFKSPTVTNEGTKKEICINAGEKYEHEILVEDIDSTIVWRFSLQYYDIGFAVYYKDGNERQEVQQYTKYEASATPEVAASFTPKKVGQFILLWDNSYSYLRSKTITYEIDVVKMDTSKLGASNSSSN